MRILVTGKKGQVVRSLRERGAKLGVEIIALGRPELDLARPDAISAVIARAKPDVVVNAAAYTAVDQAETEEELAFAINGGGAGAVAAAARAIDVPVVHISTDYVFDGGADRPYREDDGIAPVGAYGRSKAAGEEAVALANPDHAILRTAWVYSPFGKNFARTMLRLAETRDVVRVVADQHGTPTSALDIADGILAILQKMTASRDDAMRGIFHMTAGGSATWAEFAEAIYAESRARGGPFARVEPIGTADYPTPAKRPANSRLDCAKLAAAYGIALPTWRDSVGAVVARCLTER